MTNIFAPNAPRQIAATIPKPVPVKPALGPPPAGPPVEPLVSGFNFWGDIGQFAARVQQITDAHVQQHGYRPDPATVLQHAADPELPAEHLGNLFKPVTPATQALESQPIETSPMLLRSIKAFAHNGLLDSWMEQHGDQFDAMLSDPKMRPAATTALSEAKDLQTFADRQKAGGGIGEVAKGLALAPVHAAVWTRRTEKALAEDTTRAAEWAGTGGRKGSIAFPELTKTAPAVAQVVKGLVYSPAGLFDVGKALTLDSKAAASGDLSFKHSTALAKAMGHEFLNELNHPGDNIGNLALNFLGIGALGTGGKVRLARLGEEGLKSAASPHPLRTVTLEKNGFAEEISLAGSPLGAFLQEYTPFFGIKARQERLDGKNTPTTLQGVPIDHLGPQDRVTVWAQRVLTEGSIGRAGNIRRNTEYKAAMGLRNELDQATGSAAAASKAGTLINKLVGRDIFDGLTKGEVKALQALSWDDPHPLAAEERFHQSMIQQGIGSKAAHQENIALLGMARKALENPSPRFEKTLDAYARIVAKTEQLRIEMGLGVETADARIARAGAVLREETLFVPSRSWQEVPDGTVLPAGAKIRMDMAGGKKEARWDNPPPPRKSAASWYTPTIPKGKSRARIAGESPFQRGTSFAGFGPPANTNLFRHEMTGDALRAGDIRTDAHHLAGEGYARTVRAMQVVDEYKKAWEVGTPTRTSPHDIAMRDTRDIPEELRTAVAQFYDGHIDAKEANSLPEEVHQWLFPDAPGEIEGVRYIDPLVLGNMAKPNLPRGIGSKFAERANNALRPWILYGPKYALNKLGNNAMLVLDQGFLRSGQNIARALTAEKHLSPEAFARLKALTGAGRAESYVNPRSGQVSQSLADFWSRMTDNSERAAAFFYYADRKGHKDWPSIEKLLTDDTLKADLNDVVKRQDDSLVAFDRMTPWEKSTLRHYIFVYPWQRGATIWSFHTVMEHPAKTAILSELGQEAYENDEWLQQATTWVRRAGYIPLWWHHGNPVTINPTSINTFSTLAQTLQTLKAGIEGDKYAAAGDLFGPPGQFAMHAILGVDQNGNPYPGSQWLGAAEEVLNILPFVSAIKRNQKGTGEALPAFNPAHRDSLMKQYNAALKQTVLTPGWLGGFGNIFAGGFSPRELNLNADAARFWRDATPEQKHQHQVTVLNDALTMQGEYMGQPVPDGVRKALKDAQQITEAQKHFSDLHGRTPTEKEKLLITIKYLDDAGRLSKVGVAATLRNVAKQLETLSDINTVHAAVLANYSHTGELAAWDSNISTLVAFSRAPDFNQRIATLYQHGLAAQKLYRLNEKQRLDYGRKYVAYLTERDDLARQVKGRADAAAQLRIFDDHNDKPVGNLPSASRLRFGDGSTEEQTQRLDRLVASPWKSLSGVEKAALGRKVPANLSEAWVGYQDTLKAMRERDGRVTKDGKAAVANTVNKAYPGFMQDWIYSQLPRVERFERTSVYQSLPERGLFDQVILGPAKQIAEGIKKNGNSTYYKVYWRDYLKKVQPWLGQHQNLAAAVGDLGDGFLEGLVANG